MKRTSVFVILLATSLLIVISAGCTSAQVSPTATPVAVTDTPVPPTETPVPPTATPGEAGEATTTPAAAAEATDPPTPEPPTPTPIPEPSWQADGVIGEGEYAHQVDAAGVTFHWSNDAEYLYGALSAQTVGWVAVAFDPEARMQGASFVFGYVEGGQTFIEDMYGIRPAGPGSHPPDEQLGGSHDIPEYGGLEEGGVTVIEFKMSLDSGDQYDKPLMPGSSYTVLLAVGSSDDPNSYHTARDYGEIALD